MDDKTKNAEYWVYYNPERPPRTYHTIHLNGCRAGGVDNNNRRQLGKCTDYEEAKGKAQRIVGASKKVNSHKGCIPVIYHDYNIE